MRLLWGSSPKVTIGLIGQLIAGRGRGSRPVLFVVQPDSAARFSSPRVRLTSSLAFPCGTILAMFDLIDPKPRGFSGRPLIALLFAAGLGTAAYPLGSRFHLNDFTVFVILSTVTFVVGYAWEHLDARCG
jgi:hypothetical protein